MNLTGQHKSLIISLAEEELKRTMRDLSDVVDKNSPVMVMLQTRRRLLIDILMEMK